MGGFFLQRINRTLNQKNYDYNKGLDVFYRKGLKLNKVIDRNEFVIHTFYKLFHEIENTFFFNNDEFVITVGTFFYNKNTGATAASEFYEDYKAGKEVFGKLNGQFGVVLYINNKLEIFNDNLGLYHLYYDKNYGAFSNSFLAISKSCINKTISDQEIYEYLFHGTTYGNKTVFEEIEGLDREKILNIIPIPELYNKNLPVLDYGGEKSFDGLIELTSEDLINYFQMIKSNFDNNISSALSGGYDTRLMFSIMEKIDLHPKYYVSGKKDSSDVQIAQKLAEYKNIPLKIFYWEDIKKINVDDFYQLILNKYYLNDALTPKGLFLSISDMDLVNARGNILNLNGQAGEVYRDFWYLPNKSFTILDFVRSRYDSFLDKYCTEKFNKKIFLTNLSMKIKNTLHFQSEYLTRQEIDSIYPFFRTRFWVGNVNKRINYLSYGLWPFADWELIEKSKHIPVKYKFYGQFEAKLIAHISPKLAKIISNYGYNFYDTMPIKYKLKNYIKYNVPIYLRPYLRKMKVKNKKNIKPYYFSKEYLDPIFGEKPLFMETYLHTNYPDFETFSRILSLELMLKY